MFSLRTPPTSSSSRFSRGKKTGTRAHDDERRTTSSWTGRRLACQRLSNPGSRPRGSRPLPKRTDRLSRGRILNQTATKMKAATVIPGWEPRRSTCLSTHTWRLAMVGCRPIGPMLPTGNGGRSHAAWLQRGLSGICFTCREQQGRPIWASACPPLSYHPCMCRD